MIEIDGTTGEGGGQVLRTACYLSVITGQNFYIDGIRKIDKGGGLRAQHLAAINLLAEMSSAKKEGDKIGSTELLFSPQAIKGGEYKVNIKTAGSVTLVLQTLLPPTLFASEPTTITIDGGATDTFFSPTINHFQYVFLPLLEKMGADIELVVKKRGFYPKGGALLKATIKPSTLKSINLVNPGQLKKVIALSGATDDLDGVAERQLSGMKQVIGKMNLPLEEKVSYYKAPSSGSHLDIIAETERSRFGVNAIKRRNESPEEMGEKTAINFLQESKSQAPLDRYTADQLLPYMALTNKRCRIKASKITEHITTTIDIIERFLSGSFEINETTTTWHP